MTFTPIAERKAVELSLFFYDLIRSIAAGFRTPNFPLEWRTLWPIAPPRGLKGMNIIFFMYDMYTILCTWDLYKLEHIDPIRET